MEIITESLLSEVINCNKIAIKADRKRMVKTNRHKRNVIYLISNDQKYEFKLFLRQSEEFIEDFSVGLIWTNPAAYINISKNSVILIRCQGPHDGKAPLGTDIHHDFHVHYITLDDFRERRFQKPSGRMTTDKFMSFAQAISYFVKTFNVSNIDQVVELPEENNQLSLF